MDKRLRRGREDGPKHINRILNNRAMTLVEVIISILILSILLIAILSLTDVSIKGIFLAGDQNRATAKVTEKSDLVYALIIGAENVSTAEQALDAEVGCVEESQFLDPNSRQAQFYYTRSSYTVDGISSEGFDVVVVCFYGKKAPPKKVELLTFVLKMSDGE